MGLALKIFASAVLVTIVTLTASNILKTDTTLVYLSGQGKVLGSWDETLWTQQKFLSFRGIPYAESPIGKLRFKPPVSRKPWQQTYDARNFGKRCPVITTISKLNASKLQEDQEDCLNLSVYTKSLDAKQPVMFYIYGGGFYNGSASDHPPHYLLEKDIVLVVAQYRIGALGWLTTLTDEMPGNVPVMDIQLALSWVQEYIHKFGGDPTKVTIFGQSAGTAMCSVLLLSPKSPEGYFQRSILQSGSIMTPFAINRNPLAQVKSVCEKLNCTKCSELKDQNACLRNANLLELLRASSGELYGPVVGDVFGVLPSEPRLMLENLNRTLPVMAGFTKHDGTFVLANFYTKIVAHYGSISKYTVRQFANKLIDIGKYSSSLQNHLLLRMLFKSELLDTNNHTAAWPAYFDVASIMTMKSPVIAYVNALQRRGAHPAYLYTFDYEGEHTRFGYEFGNSQYPFEGGVHHTNDNIYLFATHKLNKNDTIFAKKMVDLWYSFAAHGVPMAEDQPELDIKPMETESGPYYHIDKEIRLGSDVLTEFTVTVDDPDNQKYIRP